MTGKKKSLKILKKGKAVQKSFFRVILLDWQKVLSPPVRCLLLARRKTHALYSVLTKTPPSLLHMNFEGSTEMTPQNVLRKMYSFTVLLNSQILLIFRLLQLLKCNGNTTEVDGLREVHINVRWLHFSELHQLGLAEAAVKLLNLYKLF